MPGYLLAGNPVGVTPGPAGSSPSSCLAECLANPQCRSFHVRGGVCVQWGDVEDFGRRYEAGSVIGQRHCDNI